MSPPFDPDALKAMFPDIPGWGIYLAARVHDLKAEIQGRQAWTPKDVMYIAAIFAGAVTALKGGGVV